MIWYILSRIFFQNKIEVKNFNHNPTRLRKKEKETNKNGCGFERYKNLFTKEDYFAIKNSRPETDRRERTDTTRLRNYNVDATRRFYDFCQSINCLGSRQARQNCKKD